MLEMQETAENVTHKKLQLVGVTAMFIASKFEEMFVYCGIISYFIRHLKAKGSSWKGSIKQRGLQVSNKIWDLTGIGTNEVRARTSSPAIS